jgi:hypothetical protein
LIALAQLVPLAVRGSIIIATAIIGGLALMAVLLKMDR